MTTPGPVEATQVIFTDATTNRQNVVLSADNKLYYRFTSASRGRRLDAVDNGVTGQFAVYKDPTTIGPVSWVRVDDTERHGNRKLQFLNTDIQAENVILGGDLDVKCVLKKHEKYIEKLAKHVSQLNKQNQQLQQDQMEMEKRLVELINCNEEKTIRLINKLICAFKKKCENGQFLRFENDNEKNCKFYLRAGFDSCNRPILKLMYKCQVLACFRSKCCKKNGFEGIVNEPDTLGVEDTPTIPDQIPDEFEKFIHETSKKKRKCPPCVRIPKIKKIKSLCDDSSLNSSYRCDDKESKSCSFNSCKKSKSLCDWKPKNKDWCDLSQSTKSSRSTLCSKPATKCTPSTESTKSSFKSFYESESEEDSESEQSTSTDSCKKSKYCIIRKK